MHNLLSRASIFSSFLSTVITVLLAAIALSSFYFPNEAPATVSFKDVKVAFGRHGGHYRDFTKVPSDYVLTKMDMEADFTNLFHWNTKQLFVYAVVEYNNANYSDNKVVVWDRIIKSPKKAKLNLKGQKLKYALTDITPHIVDNYLNITMYWEVVPWVGMFLQGKSNQTFGPLYLQPPQKPRKRKLAEENSKKVKNSYKQYDE